MTAHIGEGDPLLLQLYYLVKYQGILPEPGGALAQSGKFWDAMNYLAGLEKKSGRK